MVLALTADGAKQLANEAAAIGFVHDAFAHLKVIGHTAEAKMLLDKAGVVSDAGIVALGANGTAKQFVDAASGGRIWDREPKVRKVY